MEVKPWMLFFIYLLLSFHSGEMADDFYDDGVFIEDEDNEATLEDEKITYRSPQPNPNKYHFAEHFDDPSKFNKNWIKSQAMKENSMKYDGIWKVEESQRSILENDLGLVLKTKAKHAAISSPLNRIFKFQDKPLVVQYEVNLQDGQECGGSYLKLISHSHESHDLYQFYDKTPFTVMFGPDKCGNDVKLHFIFRHVNPLNGTIEEKHSKKPKERIEEPFKDKEPHLYKLVIYPDNTFSVSVDHKIVNEGHLLKDFIPPINPPKEIDDPEDFKPVTWDEREKIPDPTARKPENWDVPPEIKDPYAQKPENWLDDEEPMILDFGVEKPSDWDEEMDGQFEPPLIKNPRCESNGCGEWQAPMISNPEYKGKWRAPLIDNPNYSGKWFPKKIANPHFFEDVNPFSRLTPISAVGIEIWSMSSEVLFDNIIITDDEDYAAEWASKTYNLKRKQLNKNSESFAEKIKQIVNENPWIVAVIIVVIGLPVSIILYMLCSSSPSKKEITKKTDAMTKNDDEDENNQTASDRPSKLDLEESNETDEAKELDQGPLGRELERNANEEETAFGEVKTRKRKIRKE